MKRIMVPTNAVTSVTLDGKRTFVRVTGLCSEEKNVTGDYFCIAEKAFDSEGKNRIHELTQADFFECEKDLRGNRWAEANGAKIRDAHVSADDPKEAG